MNSISSQKFQFSILLLALSLLLSACSAFNSTSTAPDNPPLVTDSRLISEGRLVPREFRYLSFTRGGRVGEILVAKGEMVRAGQVLARLGDTDQALATLASAQLELLNVQQSLADLQRTSTLEQAARQLKSIEAHSALIAAERSWDLVDTDSYQKEIDDARVAMEDAKTRRDDAQETFDKYADLDPDNTTRKQAKSDLDKAQDTYDETVRAHDQLVNRREQSAASLKHAQAALQEAEYRAELVKDGPDIEQMHFIEARLAAAQKQAAAAQLAVDLLEITAPFDGKVIDINIVNNELVSSSAWAFILADTSEWYIETTDLTELEVVRISLGQMAEITPDALPDLVLDGEVSEIADTYTAQGGDILYQVRIKLLTYDPGLRWGMTVEIAFAP